MNFSESGLWDKKELFRHSVMAIFSVPHDVAIANVFLSVYPFGHTFMHDLKTVQDNKPTVFTRPLTEKLNKQSTHKALSFSLKYRPLSHRAGNFTAGLAQIAA